MEILSALRKPKPEGQNRYGADEHERFLPHPSDLLDSARAHAERRARGEQAVVERTLARFDKPFVDPRYSLEEQFPDVKAVREERTKWGNIRRTLQAKVDELQRMLVEQNIGIQHRYRDAGAAEPRAVVKSDGELLSNAAATLLADPNAKLPDEDTEILSERLKRARRRLEVVKECERQVIRKWKAVREQRSVEMNRRFNEEHRRRVTTVAKAIIELIDASEQEQQLREALRYGGVELMSFIMPSMSYQTESLHTWLKTAEQLEYINIRDLRHAAGIE